MILLESISFISMMLVDIGFSDQIFFGREVSKSLRSPAYHSRDEQDSTRMILPLWTLQHMSCHMWYNDIITIFSHVLMSIKKVIIEIIIVLTKYLRITQIISNMTRNKDYVGMKINKSLSKLFVRIKFCSENSSNFLFNERFGKEGSKNSNPDDDV